MADDRPSTPEEMEIGRLASVPIIQTITQVLVEIQLKDIYNSDTPPSATQKKRYFTAMKNFMNAIENSSNIEDMTVATRTYLKAVQDIFGINMYTNEGLAKDPRVTEEVLSKISQLYPYPTSSASHNINLILNGMGNTRPTRVNRNTKLEDWTTESREYTAVFENKNGTTSISVKNVDELISRYDKNVKKLFIFALQKAGNIYFNGDIVFPLQELVDLGMYSTIDSARKGFLNTADKLLQITIGGETKKGKKVIRNEKGHIFVYRKVENNICTLTISPKLNPNFIAQYFTLLPNWSYRLSNKAFSLTEYIFYLARQRENLVDLKSKGHFNISFSAINDYLQQPSPKETPNHTRDIINPILEAITEIEDTQQGTDYKFTPIYNFDYKNAVEFLQGYLQIEFTGEALNYFTERANDRENEMKKIQLRKEKALLEVEKRKLKDTDSTDKNPT